MIINVKEKEGKVVVKDGSTIYVTSIDAADKQVQELVQEYLETNKPKKQNTKKKKTTSKKKESKKESTKEE